MNYVLLSALIVVLDQLLKAWISGRLRAVGNSMTFLPGVLRLSLVHNYGASWGIMAGKTTFLLAVTALVSLAILTALLLDKPGKPLGKLSFACILGGAAGNALDRAVQGYVVDMFETEFIRFPVFNVADCFITVGAVLLVLWVLTDEREEKRRRQELSRERWEKSREKAREDAALTEETRRAFDEEHDDMADG
ncbi:MAG: signal peptidase II [Oscillospiraceae bacterium]|nr:signal peptidase II [Oscillospiraceae bacterium]